MSKIEYKVVYQTPIDSYVVYLAVHAKTIGSGFVKATKQAVKSDDELVSVEFWQVVQKQVTA